MNSQSTVWKCFSEVWIRKQTYLHFPKPMGTLPCRPNHNMSHDLYAPQTQAPAPCDKSVFPFCRFHSLGRAKKRERRTIDRRKKKRAKSALVFFSFAPVFARPCYPRAWWGWHVVRGLTSHQCGQESYVSWVCCWFLSLPLGLFSGFFGFPPSTKTNIQKKKKFQFDLRSESHRFASRRLLSVTIVKGTLSSF